MTEVASGTLFPSKKGVTRFLSLPFLFFDSFARLLRSLMCRRSSHLQINHSESPKTVNLLSFRKLPFSLRHIE